MGRAGKAAGLGAVSGIAGAVALRKVMAATIQVVPAEPLVLSAAPAVIFLVALASAWMPARRAARVDPAEALRAE